MCQKLDLVTFFNNIGDSIKDTWDNAVDDVKDGWQDFKDNIRDEVDQKITDFLLDRVFPDSSDEFAKNINGLFDRAREGRQTGANSTAQTIEIMDIFNGVNVDALCGNCLKFVDELKGIDDTSDSSDDDPVEQRDTFMDLFDIICKAYVNSTICTEAVRTFVGQIYDSIIIPSVNSTYACQRLAMCPYNINNDTLNPYVQEILQDKPTTNIPTATRRSTYQVMHMTDLHIDFSYQEGSWAQCGGYQCCRADSGAPPNASQAAGYWGTLATCDIPARTYDQFLKFVSNNFNLSFILWTGDNIDHEVWRQTQATQTEPTNNATQYLNQYFPNTTIYPMFGNHEGFFSDQYDTVGNESDWLKSELGEMWQNWFDAESLNEFETYSYYSRVNTERNLKVISLDTQTCDTLNFYLIRESSVDPLNQLEWLRQELLDAESNNQTVFIMGHIPPGSLNCDPQWSARFRALADRFTNIIRGQFYGHTHNDQFQIVRSFADESPVGVIYVSPSLTTYTSLYPSFRIFEVDADTNQVVDYQQYRLNLTKWNENTNGDIEWDLAYTFLEEYNLTNTSFASFDSLAERIKSDEATSETYAFNFNSGGQNSDNLIQRSIDYFYCSAKYSEPHEVMNCLGLDPALTNLEYFASQYVPGLLPSPENSN